MTLVAELLKIRETLQEFLEETVEREDPARTSTLEDAANRVGKSWGGSWLGYQSCVYYMDLTPPPAGAQFSQEFGLIPSRAIRGTTGDWVEYTFDSVYGTIVQLAGAPDICALEAGAASARGMFSNSQSEIVSTLQIDATTSRDPYVERLLDEVRELKAVTQAEIEQAWQPSAPLMSRDSLAVTQGFKTPPHISVLAQCVALRQPLDLCVRLVKIGTQAISHMERRERAQARADRIGTNVFIGHGRSPLWRDLKDYVRDRLKLPYDEFNRVPVAGITSITRLSQMLDAAAFALLVMTAEDEQADGQFNARLNVVHEAGLFQGRLGFGRAIVLLEDGCVEFSNIQGLGQIRFPKGQIKAAFDEVRQVLEKEGLLQA